MYGGFAQAALPQHLVFSSVFVDNFGEPQMQASSFHKQYFEEYSAVTAIDYRSTGIRLVGKLANILTV